METKFKPFDKVLVRTHAKKWKPRFFERYSDDDYPYRTIPNCPWKECIPFEGNEHLLRTTDDYVEPFEPKVGDNAMEIGYDKGISAEYGYATDDGDILESSTKEEKQDLLDALHKEGKDWDAEKKEIVDYKWMPKDGECYYYVGFDGDKFIPRSMDFIDTGRKWKASALEPYKTEEECQTLCDKLNEAIKNVK